MNAKFDDEFIKIELNFVICQLIDEKKGKIFQNL